MSPPVRSKGGDAKQLKLTITTKDTEPNSSGESANTAPEDSAAQTGEEKLVILEIRRKEGHHYQHAIT